MNIRDYIAQKKPVIFDGAMGTYFTDSTGAESGRCELANLITPDIIRGIHREYLQAGAMAIKTNTFLISNSVVQNNTAQVPALIEAASRIALDAAAEYDALVFGDIGAASGNTEADLAQVYFMQAQEFVKNGVTNILVETLSTDSGIPEFAALLKKLCPDAFLLVSFAVSPEGITGDGLMAADVLKRTAAVPEVDAVGMNCVSGPSHLLQIAEGLEPLEKPLSVMPNAGYPTVLGRRIAFQGTPLYFGSRTAALIHTGAAIVGGCCGTTPAHIAQLAAELKGWKVEDLRDRKETEGGGIKEKKDEFSEKFRSNQFLYAVELDPPKNDRIQEYMENVRTLQEAGADAITIADCPVGRPRADSSLLACKVKRELGIEPIPHMTCRDRNLNATKALLLGLSIENVHNVLIVTGDPIPAADRSEVKSVFNFNSRKLAQYISSLNENTFSSPFRIFGALNVNAANFDVQLRLAQEKEQNGVQGFLTQPVLSEAAAENIRKARAVLKGKIFGGIFPVVSYKNACFLNNEVNGIHVSDEIMKQYEEKDREEGERLAVELSLIMMNKIKDSVDGFYLMTPFQRVGLITKIMTEFKKQ